MKSFFENRGSLDRQDARHEVRVSTVVVRRCVENWDAHCSSCRTRRGQCFCDELDGLIGSPSVRPVRICAVVTESRCFCAEV